MTICYLVYCFLWLKSGLSNLDLETWHPVYLLSLISFHRITSYLENHIRRLQNILLGGCVISVGRFFLSSLCITGSALSSGFCRDAIAMTSVHYEVCACACINGPHDIFDNCGHMYSHNFIHLISNHLFTNHNESYVQIMSFIYHKCSAIIHSHLRKYRKSISLVLKWEKNISMHTFVLFL